MTTEDEQLEAFKKWWSENGRALVIALVVGLGGAGGYTYWQTSTRAAAEAASERYAELQRATAGGSFDAATIDRVDAIIAAYPDSAYAGMAALFGARAAFELDDPATTKRMLIWASEHASPPLLSDVARIRLARVLADEEDYAGATAELDQVESDAVAEMVTELRGDLLAGQERFAEARARYLELIDGEDVEPALERRVQDKLNALESREG